MNQRNGKPEDGDYPGERRHDPPRTCFVATLLNALIGLFKSNPPDQQATPSPQDKNGIHESPESPLDRHSPQPRIIASKGPEQQSVQASSLDNAPPSAVSVKASHPRDFWETVTQYYEGEPVQEKELVVGFDFGTSCSKIVIQDIALRQSYAVPFGELASSRNPYLLPTTVFVTGTGEMSLTSGNHRFSDLKVRLIGGGGAAASSGEAARSRLSAKVMVVGYIALALRHARRWFWDSKFEVYRGTRIVWQINIGLPARSYDNQELSRVFRTIALAGWNLSVVDDAITVQDAKAAVQEAEATFDQTGWIEQEGNGRIHPDYAQAVPEVIAAVIGYARSPLRQNGMYLLADIGASTLDISTFILYQNKSGEDLYSILTSEVQPLGSLRLHHKRIKHVPMCTQSRCEELKTFNDANSPIPRIQEYLPDLDKCGSIDGVFRDECSRVFSAVVAETRKKRNPNSPAWEEGLPVFLCGGGSYMPIYAEAAVEAQRRLARMNVAGLNIVELPKPVNLEATRLLPEHYHRLGVAYGLSFSRLDMGEILAPGEIEDLRRQTTEVDVSDAYVGKEMV
jgi:hypothetical protein